MTLCTSSEKKQPFLPERQSSHTELLEYPAELANAIMMQQSMLYDKMVANYDRMLTKCQVKKLRLERTRRDNARSKLTSQWLMVKIKELTSTVETKSDAVDSREDVSNDKDDDVTAEQMEVCSNTLINIVSTYKKNAENVSLELDEISDQLEESAKMQSCLKPSVEQLTLLASSDRIRRDRDELELRTTMDRLIAELDEVRLDTDRLRSVMADKSVKLSELESVHNERNAMLRAENARLEADLMTSGTVAAMLQSEVFKLDAGMAGRADVACPPQQHQRDSFYGSRDDSSASLMLYQVSLSRADHDPMVSCSDLGRGDDQSIPCSLSTKDCTATTTDDDRRPPCSKSADDDRQLSCSKSNVAETTVEQSTATWTESRLNGILKKYGSKEKDDF